MGGGRVICSSKIMESRSNIPVNPRSCWRRKTSERSRMNPQAYWKESCLAQKDIILPYQSNSRVLTRILERENESRTKGTPFNHDINPSPPQNDGYVGSSLHNLVVLTASNFLICLRFARKGMQLGQATITEILQITLLSFTGSVPCP